MQHSFPNIFFFIFCFYYFPKCVAVVASEQLRSSRFYWIIPDKCARDSKQAGSPYCEAVYSMLSRLPVKSIGGERKWRNAEATNQRTEYWKPQL